MTSEKQLGEIQFLVATPQDAQDAVNFHNAHYRARRTAEHWLWEYQTYQPDKAVFALAKHNGRVVATIGRMPVRMEVNGKPFLAAKGENLLCSAPYRGTGLVQKLREYADEQCRARGIQFRWGLGYIDQLVGRRQFTTVCRDIEVLTRLGNLRIAAGLRLRDDRPLWRRIGSLGKLLLKYYSQDTHAIPQVWERGGYEIRKGQTPYREIKELQERLRSKNKNVICLKYDEEFLSWRVRNHPFLRYDEYQVYHRGKLRAYAFVTLCQGEASISELLSEDSNATSLLLGKILEEYAQEAGWFRFIGNPMDPLSQKIFQTLRQFGFSLSMKWHITITDLSGCVDVQQFYDIRNWHVTGLWTEGFRH